MKKILSVVGASLVLAASLLVTSCGETEGDEFYATTGIASPSVTVKAYPGVNVLTWKAVKDADSYDVYVAVGENAEVFKKNILASQNEYFFTDTVEEALVAGKSLNYKYRVVANAKYSSAPLTSSEWSGSVSTKATQAANGTKFSALNSADYENEFSSDASVLSASTIKVASLVTNGYATVSFPVKSYASYKIYANYIENVNPDLLATVEGAYYKNNETATVKIAKLSGGDKTVTIVATPYYEGYEKETFTAADKITVAALNVKTGEGTRDAEAVATSETSAKISWTPAVLADGTTAATTCYTVYRKNADGSVTKVDGEVAADSTGTYYITDTIANSAVYVSYIIVLSKDGSYGDPVTTDFLSVGSLDNISVSNTAVTAEYTAEGKARIYWTAATYKEDGEEIDTKLYKVYRKVNALGDNTYTLLSATATASELYSSSEGKLGTRLYIDDTIENTKVAYIYKVVISDGTSEASSGYTTGYLSAYSANVSSVATPSVDATTYIDGTDHAKTSIKITSTKNSSDKNETLTLYYAVLAEDTSSYVIAESEWTEIKLANYDSAAGTYYNYLTEQKPGLYVFKLVASDPEGVKEDSVAYTTKTVATENVSVPDDDADLTAVKQHKTNTDGTTDDSTVVGYLCTYTDDYDSGTDSLSNYTYTLYRSVITTKRSGYSTGYITAVSTEPLKVLATPRLNTDSGNYESTYLDTDVQTVGVGESSKTINYYVVKKSATSESRVASDYIYLY